MSPTCSIYDQDEETLNTIFGEPERKKLLGKLRRRENTNLILNDSD
jgi:hypothetical protein